MVFSLIPDFAWSWTETWLNGSKAKQPKYPLNLIHKLAQGATAPWQADMRYKGRMLAGQRVLTELQSLSLGAEQAVLTPVKGHKLFCWNWQLNEKCRYQHSKAGRVKIDPGASILSYSIMSQTSNLQETYQISAPAIPVYWVPRSCAPRSSLGNSKKEMQSSVGSKGWFRTWPQCVKLRVHQNGKREWMSNYGEREIYQPQAGSAGCPHALPLKP